MSFEERSLKEIFIDLIQLGLLSMLFYPLVCILDKVGVV